MMTSRTRPWPRMLYPLALVLLVLMGAGLRLWHLDSQSLWLDETIFVEAAQAPGIGDVVDYMVHQDFHPPVYAFLLRAWLNLFGDSDFTVRLLPLCCGIMLIPLTAWAALILTKNRVVALFAAVMITFGGYHLYLSQEGRHYAWLAAIGTVHFISFIRFTTEGTRKWFALLVVSAVVGLFSHYHMLLLLAGELVLSFWCTRRRGIRFAVIFPISLFLGLWGHALLVQSGQRARWGEGLIDPFSGIAHLALHLGRDLYWTILDFSSGKYVLLAGELGLDLPDLFKHFSFLVFIFFTVMGIRELSHRLPGTALTSRGVIITLGLISVGGAIASGLHQANVYDTKYVSFVAPWWAILVAVGAQWSLSRFMGKILCIVALGALLVSASRFHMEAIPWKEDWRTVAAILQERWEPGDLLLQRRHYTAPCLDRYLDFYPERLTSGTTFLPDSSVADSVVTEFRKRGGRRLWVVMSHDEYGARMLGLLSHVIRKDSTWTRQGIMVNEFRIPKGIAEDR